MSIETRKKSLIEADILSNMKKMGKVSAPYVAGGLLAGAGIFGYKKLQSGNPIKPVQPNIKPLNADELKSKQDKIADIGDKIAYRAGGAVLGTMAATTLAIALIQRALQHRRTASCQDIEDLQKRSACYDSASKKVISELDRSMRYCENSKDPAKCREFIMHKIQIEKESKFGN